MAMLSGKFLEIVDPNSTKIKCIALAPPPVYRSNSKTSKFNQNINIFINGNDCVPRLSLANMAKLLATLRAFDQISISIQDTLKILAGLEDNTEVEANLDKLAIAITNVEQDQFPKLEHLGNIFYMRKVDSNIFKVFSTPGEFFTDSLLLLENMALDHLQPYYEEAFANVKLNDDVLQQKDGMENQ